MAPKPQIRESYTLKLPKPDTQKTLNPKNPKPETLKPTPKPWDLVARCLKREPRVFGGPTFFPQVKGLYRDVRASGFRAL